MQSDRCRGELLSFLEREMAMQSAIQNIRDKRKASLSCLRVCDARIQAAMDSRKLSYLKLGDRQFLRLMNVTRQRKLTFEVVRQACRDLQSAQADREGGDRQSWKAILVEAVRRRVRRRSRVLRVVPRVVRSVPSSHVGEASNDISRLLQQRSEADETLRLLRAKKSRLNTERQQLLESENSLCESFGRHATAPSVQVQVGGRLLRVSYLERMVSDRPISLGIRKMASAWDDAVATGSTLDETIDAFLESVSTLQQRPRHLKKGLRIVHLNSRTR